jgi:hypothetical protein
VLSALILLALVVALAGSRAPRTAYAQDEVTWLFEQINGLRAGLGLHAYRLNPQLSAAAQQHSQYMADTCDVSHTQANGSTATTRARVNGYTGGWISENIYGGRGIEAAWNFWINSGIHYQGLTHEIVNEIGIGVAYGSCGQGYTLVFGHRDGVTAPAAPAPAAEAAPAAAAEDTSAEAAAPSPPTAVPYVPPPPTFTPTPTIPTLTPSPTWTITPTPTASPEPSATIAATHTPSATPLILPTVPVLDTAEPTGTPSATAIAVAQQPDRSPTADAARTATGTPETLARAANATTRTVSTSDGTDGNPIAGWLPPLLLAGAGLLGAAGAVIWRRAR